MFLHSSAKRNFLSDLRTNRIGQGDFAQIGFGGNHTSSSTQRSDINKENLGFSQTLNFRSFFVSLSSNSQETFQQIVAHLKLKVWNLQRLTVSDEYLKFNENIG